MISGMMVLRPSDGMGFSRAKTQEEGSIELGSPRVLWGIRIDV